MYKSLDIRSRKIFFACFINTLVLVFCLPCLWAQTNSPESDSLVISPGQLLLSSGQYEAALQRATQLLTDYPDNIPIQTALLTQKANALRRLGNVQDAIVIHFDVLGLREKHYGVSSIEVSKTCQNLGNCWLDLEEPDKAIDYLNRAKNIRQKRLGNTHDDLASIFNSLSEYYRQKRYYEQARVLLNKALDIRIQLYGEVHPKLAPLLLGLSNITLDQNQYADSELILKRLIDLLEGQKDQPLDLLAIAYKNSGYCQLSLGYPGKAFKMYQKALSLLGDYADYGSIRADCLVGIGQYFLSMGESAEAESYLLQAIAFYKQNPAQNFLKIAQTQNDLGLCYRYQDQLYRAIDFHEKSIEIYYNNSKQQHPNLIGFYHNLGKCYLQKGNSETARYYFQKALTIPGPSEALSQIHSLLFIGNSFLNDQQAEYALQYFKQASEQYKTLAKKDKILYQLIYYSLGLAQFSYGKLDSALINIEKGLELLDEIASSQSNISLYQYEHAQLLVVKGHILQKKGLARQNTSFFERALDIYQKAEALTSSLQNTFRNEQSALYLLADFSSLYHGMIEVCYHLSQKDETYFNLAFQYAEAYKGAQLRRLLLKSKVKSYLGIPDSLVAREKQLQQKRVFQTQRCRQKEQEPFPVQEEISQAYQELRAIIKMQTDLKEKIDHQFPKYANLIRQDSIPSLKDIKNMLSDQQSLMEYTLSDSLIFTFVITQDTCILRKHPKPENFLNKVEDFYYLIRIRPDLQPQQLVSAEQYSSLAHQLYQELLLPVEPFLREELIIIPDDILCYIPFDPLLEKSSPYPHLFGSHAYLTHKYAIGYCYSAALLQLMSERTFQNPKNELLAFAPSFGNRLPALTYNAIEVKGIMSLLNGQHYKNESASKSRFIDNASNYRFLHLATHSALDAEFPDNSFLAFSEKPTTDQDSFLMHMSEVYNIHLQAELVTLSACQTGIGSLRRGESLISMARAFAYAGAKSIVASLWSIDDKQTSILMKFFYEHLSKNHSKSEALRRSKLQYLEQSDHKMAHPYYWAALNTIGDPAPIKDLPVRPKWSWYWGAGISMAVFVLFLFLKKWPYEYV